jgi:glutaredoxin
MDVKQVLHNLITYNSIVVLSKPSCVLCDNIKTYLTEHNIQFVNIDVTQLEDEFEVDGLELVEEIKKQTNANMFPFCYYQGVYIEIEDLKKKLINFQFDMNIEDI